MADVVDEANDIPLNYVSDALESVRMAIPEERPDLDEDVECECGEVIDPRRARLGYVYCTTCQTHFEKHEKQYNRHKVRHYDESE